MDKIYNCHVLKMIFPPKCHLCHQNFSIYDFISGDDYTNHQITINTFCCNKNIAIIYSEIHDQVNAKFSSNQMVLYIFPAFFNFWTTDKLTLSIKEIIHIPNIILMTDDQFTAKDYSFLTQIMNAKADYIAHLMAKRIETQSAQIHELQENMTTITEILKENREQLLYLLELDTIRKKYDNNPSITSSSP